MINNATMYGFYKETLKYKKDTIINSCTFTPLEEELMVELLTTIKELHPEYANKTSIINFTIEELKLLRINQHQKLFIHNYRITHKTIRDNKLKAMEVGKVPLTLTQFSFILATFNRLLWQAIINESYIFKYSLLGRIYAVCRKNDSCKPKMNWKASLANRQAILDKGGIPRIEMDARRAEFYNEQYDGEKWVESQDPFNVTIIWKRTAYSVGQIINSNKRNSLFCYTYS